MIKYSCFSPNKTFALKNAKVSLIVQNLIDQKTILTGKPLYKIDRPGGNTLEECNVSWYFSYVTLSFRDFPFRGPSQNF